MCNLYSITTNQAAISALFRAMNQQVGNLPPMPGVFPDYPAPVVRNADGERADHDALGPPPPRRTGGPPVTNIRNTGQYDFRLNDVRKRRAKLRFVFPSVPDNSRQAPLMIAQSVPFAFTIVVHFGHRVCIGDGSPVIIEHFVDRHPKAERTWQSVRQPSCLPRPRPALRS